ncbi:MAG: hypothetical protein O7F75_02390, partial [Alphaproteobacteria bacterium]|nr:hypothetical protein [Alphaproteobacteria bacterium]
APGLASGASTGGGPAGGSGAASGSGGAAPARALGRAARGGGWGGGGMYFYSVYLKLACPTPALMRGTAILLGSIFMYWRFIIAIIVGLISFRLVIESLFLAPASWFGAWIGIRFFHRADTSRFYGAFQLVLLVGAGALLWKGLDRVL